MGSPGKRTIIIHGHIFKNIGTTFDWSLQRNFGDSFIDHRDDDPVRSGHNIPEHDIRRRFERNWTNFNYHYKQLADSWIIFDTFGKAPILLNE